MYSPQINEKSELCTFWKRDSKLGFRIFRSFVEQSLNYFIVTSPVTKPIFIRLKSHS